MKLIWTAPKQGPAREYVVQRGNHLFTRQSFRTKFFAKRFARKMTRAVGTPYSVYLVTGEDTNGE